MFNINITSNICGFFCGFFIHIAWHFFDKWDIYNNFIINQTIFIISFIYNKFFHIADKFLTEIAMLFYNKNNEEHQYLDLIKKILNEGHEETGRNGKVLSIFGNSMRFSLKGGKIPILTTKKVAWKTCLKELLWFISGDTDNMSLTSQGVHIWDGNSSKEYMKTRGLSHYSEGLLGPIYGYQWRYYNAPYNHLYGIPKLKENEKNESLINFNTKKIRELNYNILKELELPTETLLDYMNKLEGYKYIDEMNELKYGTFVRWIPISDPEKIELKKGGILCDVKISDRGVNITVRGLGYYKNYVTFLMDECLIFQKLSEQEKIILLALDQLDK